MIYFTVKIHEKEENFTASQCCIVDCLPRSEYFKTFQHFNSTVGNNDRVLKVDECSPHVLATVVDFIYGIGIPEDCSKEDARSLLAMADLYLMDDLKDAVASLIATKQTDKHNLLEIAELAEKYSNKKLKESCYQFVFQNLEILDKKKLTKLCEALPMLGEKALLELQKIKGRPQNSVDVANKVLGVNLGDPFKKRGDFKSAADYRGYVMSRIEPNMLVLCNWENRGEEDSDSELDLYSEEHYNVSQGTIGRVISVDFKGANVSWVGFSRAFRRFFIDLDLLTPPVSSSLFKD